MYYISIEKEMGKVFFYFLFLYKKSKSQGLFLCSDYQQTDRENISQTVWQIPSSFNFPSFLNILHVKKGQFLSYFPLTDGGRKSKGCSITIRREDIRKEGKKRACDAFPPPLPNSMICSTRVWDLFEQRFSMHSRRSRFPPS